MKNDLTQQATKYQDTTYLRCYNRITPRDWLVSVCMQIFEHDFGEDKAKLRRNAVAFQVILTQSSTKSAEKLCADRC